MKSECSNVVFKNKKSNTLNKTKFIVMLDLSNRPVSPVYNEA